MESTRNIDPYLPEIESGTDIGTSEIKANQIFAKKKEKHIRKFSQTSRPNYPSFTGKLATSHSNLSSLRSKLSKKTGTILRGEFEDIKKRVAAKGSTHQKNLRLTQPAFSSFRITKSTEQFRQTANLFGIRRKGPAQDESWVQRFDEWLLRVSKLLQKSLKSRNIVKAINCTLLLTLGISVVIFFGIESNSLEIIMRSMEFLAEIFQSFGQFDIVFGICQQILQLAETKNDVERICKMYLRIGDICLKLKYISEAQVTLYKALEFSWIAKSQEVVNFINLA